MRRKNRQLKMTLDIPEQYEDDEEFMEAFMARLDTSNWKMGVGDKDDEELGIVPVTIKRLTLGEIEIEPEEEEED